jgi:hypothetical protein
VPSLDQFKFLTGERCVNPVSARRLRTRNMGALADPRRFLLELIRA